MRNCARCDRRRWCDDRQITGGWAEDYAIQALLATPRITLVALDGEIGPGTRLLVVITSPTIALLQMTVGVYGLVFEFMSPGAVAPGVIGAIGLLLALYGL